MLLEELPAAAAEALFADRIDLDRLRLHLNSVEDQVALRASATAPAWHVEAGSTTGPWSKVRWRSSRHPRWRGKSIYRTPGASGEWAWGAASA